MRILAFTDIHGSKEALKDLKEKANGADIILCAGDITVFGDKMKSVVKEIAGLGKRILMVHGNHEDEQELEKECAHYPSITFIHKKLYSQSGFYFAGYGGGGFATQDKEFERFIDKVLEKAKGKPLVILTHGPPHGCSADFLHGVHVGNKSYTMGIKKAKPVLLICGHLHENFEVQDMISKSVIVNPGPLGKMIKIQ